MAASERRPRRGPAPIASFDHDVSEESSPETKQSIRLPEIREDPASSTAADSLAPPELRARSHSSPAVHVHAPAAGLQAPPAPRIDISRASSSSHHDSRDSSPELAMFAGGEDSKSRLELGFREDGALDLRSSTEELAFLEGAPGEPEQKAPPTLPSRRHSRKDSQSSEAALLAVSGRTSRISSVGSQCSAHSVLSSFSHTSRVSRLSVVSGVSRSPSPHKMLLETSFCGPKPIETDPEICGAAVEERLLEIAKLSSETISAVTLTQPSFTFDAPLDARDRREVRTEVTMENTRPSSAPRLTSPSPQPTTSAPLPSSSSSPTPALVPTISSTSPVTSITLLDDDKRLKETRNRARAEEHRTKSKERRKTSQPEVYSSSNRAKTIIRIKLKPDEEYDDDEEDESEHTLIGGDAARKPVTLELNDTSTRLTESVSPQLTPRRPRDSRTPSPTGVTVSRKSSFCSLFKSRETIASPDSPSDVLKRKKSLNEGRSRSKSRDRAATLSSSGKLKGSVLSLFKNSRKSTASPSPGSRDVSPVVQQQQRQFPQTPVDRSRSEKLKYYEDSKDGIIHIPLRTPPDELNTKEDKSDRTMHTDSMRPASAPQPRISSERPAPVVVSKPSQRTVLPDGSIIIPLHSPTEKTVDDSISNTEEITVVETPTSTITLKKQPNGCGLLRNVENVIESHSSSKTIPSVPLDSESTTNKAMHSRKKERIMFSTHVGSQEQVFSTQFSITKTPSVTSEISESIPSFPESDEIRQNDVTPSASLMSPDTFSNVVVERPQTSHAANEPPVTVESPPATVGTPPARVESPPAWAESSSAWVESSTTRMESPVEAGRGSSGSEAGSERGSEGGSEAERRGLVVQESFEELPYVPTTLPQERSLALPMVPVRERGGVRVQTLQRPRATRPAAPLAALSPSGAGAGAGVGAMAGTGAGAGAAPSTGAAAGAGSRLHIRLPQRARAVSAGGPTPPPRSGRPRSRSGGDGIIEARGKADWIDFSEMPEWRMEPKRIETLPKSGTARAGAGEGERERGPGVVFSYVPPERCRCECHAHAPGPPDDEQPLLEQPRLRRHSSSSLEYDEEAGTSRRSHADPARPQ